MPAPPGTPDQNAATPRGTTPRTKGQRLNRPGTRHRKTPTQHPGHQQGPRKTPFKQKAQSLPNHNPSPQNTTNTPRDNNMLIMHAAQLKGDLVLWCEDSQPPQKQPDQQQAGQESNQNRPEPHPHAAQAPAVAEAASIQAERGNTASAIAWLPTQGPAPIPSSAMAGPTKGSRAKPRIKPWDVPILRLRPEQAMPLLQRCRQQQIIKPGVAIAPDLAFWSHAAALAVSLTARQQFLPSLHQQDEQPQATWTPVYIGDDAQRLADLAALMPACARALTDTTESTDPPDIPAQAALRDFLAAQVDCLARHNANLRKPAPTKFDSAHDAWLSALQTADSTLRASPAQLQQLRQQAAEWQRPLAITANSPYRLCLRLEEPPEPSPEEEAPAIRQDDWYLRYLLQPHDDQSLLLPAENVWKNQVKEPHPDFNPPEFLLSSLAQASSVCPPITDSLKAPEPSGSQLDTQQAHQFLESQAAGLQQAGFGVLLPAWWTRQGTKTRPTIRARAKPPAMQGGSGISLTSLIDLDIEVALGDAPMSAKELHELAALKTPLVRLRGQWVEINADDIQAAADFWRNRQQVSLREIVQIGLGADQRAREDNLSLQADDWLQDLLEQLKEKGRIEQMDPPEDFAGQLRPYQQLGYAWLTFLKRWGLGACLADDMGLGKTVQTLAALQLDRQQGNNQPNLLVCPTSVINNWQRETARFTPDLAALVHHGPQRQAGDTFRTQAQEHQLVITSYGTMNRDQDLLGSVPWRAIILDEAHNIKNPASQQARAARGLPADYRIALTGTPVENHVGDLWSIMQFLNPGLLGTQAEFKRNYFQPIQTGRDEDAAARLQKATGPFILRRLKTDRSIIDDLPDKSETKQYCNLTREQATLYQAVLQEAETNMESAEGIKRRGSILATLTKLKQACNHPRQLLGDNSAIPGRSGKMARLQEILDEVLPAGDRVLLFSQFAEMGAILQQHVQETYGLETPFLHGGVSRKQRDLMAQRFQNDPDGPQVFVLSLKAGGSGLNLPRANHVVHYDRWWNPAVENQATDRAFRIGQTRDVHVHKLICAGTLEDRIDLMIETKQQTADQVVSTTPEQWLTEMSNADLREVLALSASPVD